MSVIRIEHFTDAGCPFAFSAEPQRRALQWRFGDDLEWVTRMVVLSESTDDYAKKGFDTTMQAASHARIARLHGMPIDPSQRPRMLATVHAARAFVAVRRRDVDASERFLRALRVAFMTDRRMIDDPAVIEDVAGSVGIDRGDLRAWTAEPDTEAEMRADMEAARTPAPGALALDHKLAGPEGRRRYTCPSYVISSEGRQIAVPGFQPLAAYEVAIANVAPHVAPRPAPEDIGEVLRFFAEPLTAAEIAAVLGIDVAGAQDRLATEAVQDGGYWSLEGTRLAA